jgi:hypothetical protein
LFYILKRYLQKEKQIEQFLIETAERGMVTKPISAFNRERGSNAQPFARPSRHPGHGAPAVEGTCPVISKD